MSELYSGKYEPPPVRVVGYWAHRPAKEKMFTLFTEYGLAGDATINAVSKAFRMAKDMEMQEQKFAEVFK